MKKQIFGGIAIVAIAVAVALNVNMVNKKSDKASLLALANVEALADQIQIDLDQNTVGSGGTQSGGITCHRTCYHSPAVCWGTEWTYNNMDCWCYPTGYMKDKCYANKCR